MVRTKKRKLRIPEVHQQRSRSLGRFSFLFLSFLSSFFLTFSLSNGGGSLPSEESRNITAAYGVGIPRLWVGIHKIFVRCLTTMRVHRCFSCA